MVPDDRYFIETDCPYLAPIPHRGKRNEPAFVVETARAIGELRGMKRDEVGQQTADNFQKFFALPT
jgi:TatD DNase family protein